jgi:hypothetical protein
VGEVWSKVYGRTLKAIVPWRVGEQGSEEGAG